MSLTILAAVLFALPTSTQTDDAWTRVYPAGRTQVRFARHTVSIGVIDGDGWSFDLSLQALSRAGRTLALQIPTRRGSGARVEYEHGAGLIEWYADENGQLEQGFDLAQRPHGEGFLEFRLQLPGSITIDENGLGATLRPEAGPEAVRFSGLRSWDATGRDLTCHLRPTVGGFAIMVDDSGARYPITVDPLIVIEEGKLLATGGQAGDAFGSDVAIDGDFAVVGARNTGRAFVYRRVAGAWVQDAELFPGSGGSPSGQRFGDSVGIAGELCVVGAWLNSSAASNAGAAFVYERQGGVWTEATVLTASDAGNNDHFAFSISMDGDFILVGSDEDDISGMGNNVGSAYVFHRDGAGVWIEEAKLVPSDGTPGDLFAWSVGIHGNLAVCGAWQDDPSGSASGSGYVFRRTVQGLWIEEAKLRASDGAAGDGLGFSADAGSNYVVLGAQTAPVAGLGDAGAAYVYSRDVAGNWTESAKLLHPIPAASDLAGNSVAAEGNRILVGVPRDNYSMGVNRGSAALFTRSAGVWSHDQQVQASDSEAADNFGTFVGLGGGKAIVGAPGEDDLGSSAGAAYVFNLEGPSLGSNYCGPAVANSSGQAGTISAGGSDVVLDNLFFLSAEMLPQSQVGYFLLGQTQGFVAGPGGSQGNLCLGGAIGRFAGQVQDSGAAGVIGIQVDLGAIPLAGASTAIQRGETWSFQAWFRDQNPGATSNFTDGVVVTF